MTHLAETNNNKMFTCAGEIGGDLKTWYICLNWFLTMRERYLENVMKAKRSRLRDEIQLQFLSHHSEFCHCAPQFKGHLLQETFPDSFLTPPTIKNWLLPSCVLTLPATNFHPSKENTARLVDPSPLLAA